MQSKDIHFGDHVNLSPSFSIQSLLHKIPGSSSDSSQFHLNTILQANSLLPSFIKTSFSVFHINIAFLSRHIDDLKILLDLLEHPWDVIAISETKIREECDPLINISIDGYDFIQTPTKSFFGGVGLYVKNGIEYKVREDLNKSIHNVSESVFIELKDKF